MNIFREKIREVVASVFPVAGFVLILQLIFRPMSGLETGRFIFASLLIIGGLSLFLLGIDLSITPMGNSMGRGLVKSRNIPIILFAAFILGFLINAAEPDLLILAQSIDAVSGGQLPYLQLIITVSLGVGLIVMVGFVRLLRSLPLKHLFAVIYGLIFILALLGPGEYLAIAFDASGATTGAITTPFLLALSAGLAVLSHHSSEAGVGESFGMVGLASSGAILAVLLLGLLRGGGALQGGSIELSQAGERFFDPFVQIIRPHVKDALLAILPLTLIFLFINKLTRDMKRRQLRRVYKGLIYCILGLSIFTVAVNGSFMEAGQRVGQTMASLDKPYLLVLIGFFLGMTVVLAEPAVHVLTQQIEKETGGFIPRKLVLIFLSGGVAIGVSLAMLRLTLPGLQLWHLLLPAYVAALGMSWFSDELFVGIAFDSGGVVSGPMTATFVLAFTQGAASVSPGADVILDGFGVIALVAMTPLLSLQILGLIYQHRSAKSRRLAAAEHQALEAANAKKDRPTLSEPQATTPLESGIADQTAVNQPGKTAPHQETKPQQKNALRQENVPQQETKLQRKNAPQQEEEKGNPS